MPPLLLSIDLPGKYEGGLAYQDRLGVVLVKPLLFTPGAHEAEDYRTLSRAIVPVLGDPTSTPDVVIMEHPFLHILAQYVGAIKMVCAYHNISWYMVGASRAKKLVLNKGNASKGEVLIWARNTYRDLAPTLTQHTADALLYLAAYQTK